MNFGVFSSREVAIAFWVLICVVAVFLDPGPRNGALTFIKTLFTRRIQASLWSIVAYFCIVTILFWYLNLWDFSLFKDTLYFVFGEALLIAFALHKKYNDEDYFTNLVKGSFSVLVVYEFIANFYTFSLVSELIITFLLIFFSLISFFAGRKEEHQLTARVTSRIVTIIGVVYFSFSFVKMILHYTDTFTFQNFKAVALGPTYLILFFPFIYFFSVYMMYGVAFSLVKVRVVKKKQFRKAKRLIFRYCKLNFFKIREVRRNIYSINVKDKKELKTFLKSL